MQEYQQLIEEIDKLIIENELEKAIDRLIAFFKDRDEIKYDDAIFQKSKINGLQRDMARGLITYEYSKIQEAQIRDAIQFLTSQVSETQQSAQEYQRQKYNTGLRQLYEKLVMDDDEGMRLKDIYVEPDFKVYRGVFDRDDERLIQQGRSEFIEVDYPGGSIHQYVYEILGKKDSLGIFQKRPRPQVIFVLGYPGQGKTSFCKRLFFDLLSPEEQKNFNKQIFLVRMRNLGDARQLAEGSLLEILRSEAEEQAEGFYGSVQDIHRREFNRSLLVLDGLDELLMQENFRIEDIDNICHRLIYETEDKPELQIILTSRYGYIDIEQFQKDSVLILQLKEFDLERQKEWLIRYKCFHQTWLSSEKLEEFNQGAQFWYISELIRQPLLMHLIASLTTAIEEDINRARVYDLIFTELITRRYDMNRRLSLYEGISKDDVRELIREIAFAIYQTGNNYINRNDLLKVEGVQQFLKKFPNKNFQSSPKGILMSFYLRETRSPDMQMNNYAIEFLHQSLRDYMVAEKIFTSLKEQFLEKTQRKNQYVVNDWQQALHIAAFLFARKRLKNEIVDYLVDLIENEEQAVRSELATQLSYFFPELIRHDFLYEYDCRVHLRPMDMCTNTFFGYWTVLSYSGMPNNILQDPETRERFVYLLHSSEYHRMNLPGNDFVV